MQKRLLIIAVIGFVLGGCSTTRVVDVDPEKVDTNIHGKLKYQPTPGQVVVGEKDRVRIEVIKRGLFKDEQADGLELQRWDAIAVNQSSKPKCVTPLWRLMDFEYISDGPSERLVRPHSSTYLGEMRQRTWIIDGVTVAPPPSGYLADLRIRGTVKDAKPGEECIHLADEDDVKEQ